VQLINDDYEAFISLSTDLRGEGTRLERLKWPLADLRSQTLVRVLPGYTVRGRLVDSGSRSPSESWNSSKQISKTS